jgi:hypothetical protein
VKQGAVLDWGTAAGSTLPRLTGYVHCVKQCAVLDWGTAAGSTLHRLTGYVHCVKQGAALDRGTAAGSTLHSLTGYVHCIKQGAAPKLSTAIIILTITIIIIITANKITIKVTLLLLQLPFSPSHCSMYPISLPWITLQYVPNILVMDQNVLNIILYSCFFDSVTLIFMLFWVFFHVLALLCGGCALIWCERL